MFILIREFTSIICKLFDRDRGSLPALKIDSDRNQNFSNYRDHIQFLGIANIIDH